MRKIAFFLFLLACTMCKAQIPASGKVSQEKMLERFLAYVKIESQSIDEPSMTFFPMTDGQREIARYIYDEVRGFGGRGVRIVLSNDNYYWCNIFKLNFDTPFVNKGFRAFFDFLI